MVSQEAAEIAALVIEILAVETLVAADLVDHQEAVVTEERCMRQCAPTVAILAESLLCQPAIDQFTVVTVLRSTAMTIPEITLEVHHEITSVKLAHKNAAAFHLRVTPVKLLRNWT